MLVDANILLFALNRGSPSHRAAVAWLTRELNGARRVGLPWQSLAAVLRIATHPRAFDHPLDPVVAWKRVNEWLESPAGWVPQAGARYADILGDLIVRHHVRGNLVPDAQLAALAIEHGLIVISADTDFGRFPEVTSVNPLRD